MDNLTPISSNCKCDDTCGLVFSDYFPRTTIRITEKGESTKTISVSIMAPLISINNFTGNTKIKSYKIKNKCYRATDVFSLPIGFFNNGPKVTIYVSADPPKKPATLEDLNFLL